MSTPTSPDDPPDLEITRQVLEIGAHLGSTPSARLVETAFRRELEDQLGLSEAIHSVDLAHTLVMMEAGIVPPDMGRALLAALLRLRAHPEDFRPDPSRGDLYTNREAWLATQTPAAQWLGAGRARREATTTAFLIRLRSGLLDLAESLANAASDIVAGARHYRSALMPDYTYLQAAQPTTFGHYLIGFVYPMLRDLDRIQGLYQRVNRSPAGCGSTNGSRLPQDREQLRKWLGFDGLVVHARDAMWQADLPIEIAAVLTAMLVNLDRLAEDLQIYATEEFGLIELDDGHARASKIMPQKKNPFALTHVRGTASVMIGTLTASAAVGRTPSGQPDNRLPLYGLIPRAIDDTRDAVDLMGEVVRLLTFDERCGRARLASGCALAADLAETLVLECGLGFREAHRLVGHLVARHQPSGDFTRLTPDLLAATAEQVLGRRIHLSEASLRSALDADSAVSAHKGPGGASPEAMETMIAECERILADFRSWVEAKRGQLASADDRLLREAGVFAREAEPASPGVEAPLRTSP